MKFPSLASLSQSKPEIAESFGRLASPDGKTGVTTMPVRFRADQVWVIELDGSESNLDILGAVADLLEAGL